MFRGLLVCISFVIWFTLLHFPASPLLLWFFINRLTPDCVLVNHGVYLSSSDWFVSSVSCCEFCHYLSLLCFSFGLINILLSSSFLPRLHWTLNVTPCDIFNKCLLISLCSIVKLVWFIILFVLLSASNAHHSRTT